MLRKAINPAVHDRAHCCTCSFAQNPLPSGAYFIATLPAALCSRRCCHHRCHSIHRTSTTSIWTPRRARPVFPRQRIVTRKTAHFIIDDSSDGSTRINRAVIDAGVCDAMVELAQRTRVDKPCKELSTASVVYGCLYGYRKQVHSGGDAGSEEASPSAGQPNPLSLMDHQCPIRAPMQGGASIHVTGFKRTRRRIADVLAGKYSIPSDSSRGDVVGVFATYSVHA